MCNLRQVVLSIEAMKELLRFLFPSQVVVASLRAKSPTMNALVTKTKSAS
jgi:hypothetical protein